MIKYYVRISINGRFEFDDGLYVISEKFHKEIVDGIKDQVGRGKAKKV